MARRNKHVWDIVVHLDEADILKKPSHLSNNLHTSYASTNQRISVTRCSSVSAVLITK